MTLPTMSSQAYLLELQLRKQKRLTSIVNALLILLDLNALLSRLDHCMLSKILIVPGWFRTGAAFQTTKVDNSSHSRN